MRGAGWLGHFGRVKVFGRLRYWWDPKPRSGPENMAVDALLLDRAGGALLRVYRWEPGWGSFGVFGNVADARAALADGPPRWVRRPTGGGVVDHRADWTYSLVVGRDEPPASWPARASYAAFHAALGEALGALGEPVRMVEECGACGPGGCFAAPVAYDLLDASGRKRAGAGQRRTRTGLLHQGSVWPGAADPEQLGLALATALGELFEPFDPSLDPGELAARTAQFASAEWLERRAGS